jgi:hypothetical protein
VVKTTNKVKRFPSRGAVIVPLQLIPDRVSHRTPPLRKEPYNFSSRGYGEMESGKEIWNSKYTTTLWYNGDWPTVI